MDTNLGMTLIPSDPFAQLLAQEAAKASPEGTPPTALPKVAPRGDKSPFLKIPGEVLPPAPEPGVVSEAAVAAEASPEVPVEAPPKRKRGRPRKEAATETEPVKAAVQGGVSARDLVLSQPLDRAWISLGDHIVDSKASAAALRKTADEVGHHATEIAELEAEIATLQAVVDQLIASRESLGSESELRSKADAAEEQAAHTLTIQDKVAELLVSLNEGASGTLGSVRITVIDGTAHIDRAGNTGTEK